MYNTCIYYTVNNIEIESETIHHKQHTNITYVLLIYKVLLHMLKYSSYVVLSVMASPVSWEKA